MSSGEQQLTRCDDAEILRRTAAGDTSAFEVLMDRHQAAVMRFIGVLTNGEATGEEALQETFVAAWRGAAGFRGRGSARSWLFSIARNAVYRQFRRRSGEPDSFDDLDELADLGVRAGWGGNDRDMLAALETSEQIERGLRNLSTADREVLVLRDVEGFTAPEVAALLDVEVGAVKSRLHRARLRFVANLTGGPHESS